MKKYTLLLALCAGLMACKQDKPDYHVSAKYYLTFTDNPLPKGICRFWVNGEEFMDSCNKYSVGDTIHFK